MTGDAHSAYTVVGGGAIGGTLAHALARAGHDVTVVDTDAEHVAAIRARGLTIARADGADVTVPLRAATPEEFAAAGGASGARLERVLLVVKAQATEAAMAWIGPRLAADGYVVSVQNGFNEDAIAAHVGPERVIAAFVNIFADVTAPGVIRDGGPGAFVLGEPGGAPVSERVRRLVADLQAWGPARASDNVEGYLWAKAGFGAMLSATALADAPMAELIDAHRPTMHAVAGEVFDVAAATGARLEPFDTFEAAHFRRAADPADRATATDRLVAWLRTQPKDRSGIWRDLAVRRRPVEVTTHYATVFAAAERAGVPTPVLRAVVDGLRELERDPSGMSRDRLAALDRLAAGAPAPAPAPAATPARRLPTAAGLTAEQARRVRDWLAAHREQLATDLTNYASQESSSDDPAALRACLAWARDWLDGALGPADAEELLERGPAWGGAGDVLIRRYPGTGAAAGAAPVLLLCHYDTVWPTGTLAEWPVRREGTGDAEVLSGPGVFDMKAGLVQAVWALRALDALGLPRPPCTLLLNGDEETGSRASRDTIAAEARASRAALVFEASADGALKTTRKGVGLFTLTVRGEEAHAGLDPTAGASAIHELARQVGRLVELTDLAVGTSVNVGVVRGGTLSNVIAGRASADLDIRVATDAERQRIAAELARLRPVDPRTELTLEGEWNRPVLERTPEVAALFELARGCAAPLGLQLRETAVGGASDGNFVQAAGAPVLDGLGAVGGGAHARSEHVTVSGMVERAALAAGVLAAFAVDGGAGAGGAD